MLGKHSHCMRRRRAKTGSIEGVISPSCMCSFMCLKTKWPVRCFFDLPQVLYVRNKMDETGVDMMVDVHGDVDIPYCFVSGEF